MTYNSNMNDIEQLDSYELYTFSWGGEEQYNLTSYFKNVSVGETEFVATAGFMRSDFSEQSDSTPAELVITLPADHAIAQIVSEPNDVQKISVKINRRFSDGENRDIFTGEVVGGAQLQDGKCELSCKNTLYLFTREIARIRMQSICNNTLYDAVCGLDETSPLYKISASVMVDATGKILTSTDLYDAITKPDGFFTLGKIVYNGIMRLITSHTHSGLDGIVTINAPITGMDEESSPVGVTAYAGCDKHPATCKTVFDNLTNFVGMPYIPLKDPKKDALTNG